MRIEHCARCGGTHDDIDFKSLAQPFSPPEAAPVVWSKWAPCPANGEPIMMSVVDRATGEEIVAKHGSAYFEEVLVVVYQVFQQRRESLGEAEAFASTVREFYGKWKPVATEAAP